MGSHEWRGIRDTALDPIKKVVTRRIIRALQRVLESHLVGRTVAFENQAPQSQQRSAVVTPVVDPVLESRQDRIRNHCREPCQQVA